MQGYQVAFVLIALAAVFDFFDGFTARLLHAVSPLGKELDSLSDAVSFGLAPGMVLYNMLVQYEPESGVAYIAMLIPVFGALRLAKFNVSTDQSTTFTGLPIPANAIFWIGFTNFYAEHHADVPVLVVAGLGVARAAEGDILDAALGLGAPVAVRRDRDLAHGVVFDAGIHR